MKKSATTRVRILDAAAKRFRRTGYAATTVNDIAKLARVRAASLYYYFESKDELFEEVLNIGIDRIFEKVRRAVEAMPSDATYRQRIQVATETHLITLLKHSDYTAANIINFGLAPTAIRTRHHRRREAYGDFWRALLKKAQLAGEIRRDVDLSLFRLFLIGALNWTEEWYRREGHPIPVLADKFCDLLFDGARPRPTHAAGGDRAHRKDGSLVS